MVATSVNTIEKTLAGAVEGLHPAPDVVVEYFARLNQHGLESGEASVPMLGGLKHIRCGHGGDFNAKLAGDAKRSIHVKVAGEQHLFPCHVLNETRCLNSVFARAHGAPLGDHGFAGNSVRGKKVEDAWAAAAADHNLFEAPGLPCIQGLARAPVGRIRDAASVVGSGAEEDEDIATWPLYWTGTGPGPPRDNRGRDHQNGDEPDDCEQMGERSSELSRRHHAQITLRSNNGLACMDSSLTGRYKLFENLEQF